MSRLNSATEILRHMLYEAKAIRTRLEKELSNLDNMLSREREKGLIHALRIVDMEIDKIAARIKELEEIDRQAHELANAVWEATGGKE